MFLHLYDESKSIWKLWNWFRGSQSLFGNAILNWKIIKIMCSHYYVFIRIFCPTCVAPRFSTFNSEQFFNGVKSDTAVPPSCRMRNFGQSTNTPMLDTEELDKPKFRNSWHCDNASMDVTRVPDKYNSCKCTLIFISNATPVWGSQYFVFSRTV